jgi:hypothetical protein
MPNIYSSIHFRSDEKVSADMKINESAETGVYAVLSIGDIKFFGTIKQIRSIMHQIYAKIDDFEESAQYYEK